jgi:peptide/nickel transport system substrate-binding protein
VNDYGCYEARWWTLQGKEPGADDSTIVYGMSTDIKNIIETLSEITYDTQVHYLMYDALIMHVYTELDPKYEKFMPALAQSWDVSPDEMTYTFHLRTDVKWHDGVQFTSKDVKFTYDAIIDPETAAADAQYWREYVANVTTPDDYTVVVQM